jgi:cell division inhibitor SulA
MGISTHTQKPHGALDALLQHPAIWRAARPPLSSTSASTATVATGYIQLDRLLPQSGWPASELVELLCPQWGVGEIQLLSMALAGLSQQARWIVWVAPPWIPYGPALASRGIALDKLIIVRAATLKDQLWALEQCLASGACSAVLGWPDTLQSGQVRRLQLAAQKGRCLGVILRPEAQRQQASPAPLRLELGLPGTHINARIVKCRGTWGSPWLQLPWWAQRECPVDDAAAREPGTERVKQLIRTDMAQ